MRSPVRSERPVTLEQALRALADAEEKLRSYEEGTAVLRLAASASSGEAKFRMLAEGVPNQLLFLDRDLRIEFANNVFLEASGWSAEAAHGRHISEVVGEEGYRMRRQHYERALAGESITY